MATALLFDSMFDGGAPDPKGGAQCCIGICSTACVSIHAALPGRRNRPLPSSHNHAHLALLFFYNYPPRSPAHPPNTSMYIYASTFPRELHGVKPVS